MFVLFQVTVTFNQPCRCVETYMSVGSHTSSHNHFSLVGCCDRFILISKLSNYTKTVHYYNILSLLHTYKLLKCALQDLRHTFQCIWLVESHMTTNNLPFVKYGCLTCWRAETLTGHGRGRVLGLFQLVELETELTAPAPGEVCDDGNSLGSIVVGDDDEDAEDWACARAELCTFWEWEWEWENDSIPAVVWNRESLLTTLLEVWVRTVMSPTKR